MLFGVIWLDWDLNFKACEDKAVWWATKNIGLIHDFKKLKHKSVGINKQQIDWNEHWVLKWKETEKYARNIFGKEQNK